MAIAAAMAFSVVLPGHASASQTGGARRSTERTAGMAQPKATHARLVLSPNAVVIEAGDSVHYTAEGYDDAGNYLGDVTPVTTFSVGKDACKRAICTAKPGTYTVTGTFYINDTAVTGTADLLVLPRPLASLKLRPNPAVIEAGGSQDYTAEGLDEAGGSLGDLTAYTSFSVSPDGSCAGATCTPANAGDHTVTGTVDVGNQQVIGLRGPAGGYVVSGTADLLVPPRPLASLKLRPNPAVIEAGGSQDYTAEGLDEAGRSLGDLTAYTSFSVSPDGSCAGATCTPANAGDHTVTGTVDLGKRQVTGTADMLVLGPLARVTLRPNPATITAGDTVTYTADGQDANGNPRGDVTADTSFSISPDGSCAGATCTATKAGDHTVTAAVAAGRRQLTATAVLHVAAGPLASLTLRPSQATITAGDTVTYTADGQDANGNPRGDVTADTSFSISPDGSCAGATCIATKAGDHTVTAAVAAGRRQLTATAVLHVAAGPVASLALRPSQATITAGDTVTYTADGRDANGNPRGDVTADTSFSISPDGSCAGATCTATKAGDHTVTGVYAGRRQLTATAVLHVAAGPLASLALRPSQATITAGDTVTYTADGRDANGNPRGDVTADTSFSISPDGSCTGATCTAAHPGRHTVTGTATGSGTGTGSVDAGGSQVGTAELLVLPRPLASLALRPDPATITAGGSSTYTDHGLDAAGHDLGDLTAGTRFSISPDGSCAGATCTATKAGDHTVTAAVAAVAAGRRQITAAAVLHVAAGPLASLTLRPSQATITAGDTVTYTADGQDANGNPRGDVTADTSFSISPDGSCTGATCTAAGPGRTPSLPPCRPSAARSPLRRCCAWWRVRSPA